MSTSCSTSATATQTQVLTTDSLSTSFSLSVESGSSTVRTLTLTTCLAEPSGSSGTPTSSCSTFSSVTTIPGGEITTSVPVVITVPITSTSVTTLLGSSCTVINTEPSSTSTTTFTSEVSSTLPNGSVSVGTVTVTSLIPQTSSPSEPTEQSNQHSSSDDTNLGGIIGGAVGGVFGLLAFIFVIWFLIKRRKTRWDDIFEKEDYPTVGPTYHGGEIDEPTLPNVGTPETLEPKPYEYGLVGNAPAPNPHPYNGNGFGGVPAPRPQSASFPSSGVVPGMAVGHPGHNSMLLSPQQQQQFQQQFADTGRPTSMHSAGSSHGGQSPRPSYTGYPTSNSGHTSPGQNSPPVLSPAMSPGAWNSNGTGQSDGQFNPGIGGFVPMQHSTGEYFSPQGQGPLPRPHTSPTPSTHGSRTGSDSIQPQQQPGRRLQVMNGGMDESLVSLEGGSSGARPSSHRSQSSPIGEKQRLSAAMNSPAGQGNSVMVHRDGGRVDEAGPSGHRQQQSESEPGLPPPAYEE
ncbi:hypothetical protein VKT23_004668 [Stygiomarasmius scandens]|uniref:Uncharacterized protein n=1 Tax=Marasmiellus scandens TaxID=2682957 RepID=A0ABR1JXX4_9AGAR